MDEGEIVKKHIDLDLPNNMIIVVFGTKIQVELWNYHIKNVKREREENSANFYGNTMRL